MSNNKEVVYGLYTDETHLLSAVKSAGENQISIMDVYSPFPVHGLDPLLDLTESRIHIAGFIYGLLGTLTAVLGMTWIAASDWPLIFGGKPYWAFPSYVPIIFEVTVLFACIGMVVTFFTVCGLGPGVNLPILDDSITDDKFCIAFDTSEVGESEARDFLKRTGAAEINKKNI